MNKALLLALLTLGCAQKPSPGVAFDSAAQALGAIGVFVEESGGLVDAATELRMQRCADAFDRAACMGRLGLPVAPTYQRVGVAYDAAVRALEELRKAYDELEPIMVEATRELGR